MASLPASAIRDAIPSPADQAVIAAIQLRARQSAAWILKRRARDYRARPAQLEIIYPGLACASPEKLIAVGEVLLRKEAQVRRVEIVPVKAINARAVILLGRWRRLVDAKLAEVA